MSNKYCLVWVIGYESVFLSWGRAWAVEFNDDGKRMTAVMKGYIYIYIDNEKRKGILSELTCRCHSPRQIVLAKKE